MLLPVQAPVLKRAKEFRLLHRIVCTVLPASLRHGLQRFVRDGRGAMALGFGLR
jgi:hypothetical protein